MRRVPLNFATIGLLLYATTPSFAPGAKSHRLKTGRDQRRPMVFAALYRLTQWRKHL
jgi:hypothetical protein